MRYILIILNRSGTIEKISRNALKHNDTTGLMIFYLNIEFEYHVFI